MNYRSLCRRRFQLRYGESELAHRACATELEATSTLEPLANELQELV